MNLAKSEVYKRKVDTGDELLARILDATACTNKSEDQLRRKGQLKCDGTRAETRFRLSAKRTSPFKSAGGVSSVDYWQKVCASAVVMLDAPCSGVM